MLNSCSIPGIAILIAMTLYIAKEFIGGVFREAGEDAWRRFKDS
jgi:hypothetical protein